MFCTMMAPSSATTTRLPHNQAKRSDAWPVITIFGLDIARDQEAIRWHISYMSQNLSLYDGTPQELAHAVALAHPGVRDVAPHGARLHVLVDDATVRIPQLAVALESAQVRDVRIERIEPSLEDVVVAIVDRFLAKNDFAAKTHRRDAEGAENPENEP